MEFGLLGLFEVREGSRAIDLPRGKERALLAALLLRANEPVSTDRLIEELWPDQPPANAAKTVQVYVSRLRKSVGAERLRTTPAGYVIRVEPGELDSDEFERLAADGRERLADGEAAAAERSLSQALALWRGQALADFRFDSFAQFELRRLEELRVIVRLDRIDARLALGQAEQLIPELETLVAESPLQERPRAQLMLALYRAGRQADALGLYRKTRALLGDELGIEPGPELQALERAILNHEESLTAPSSPATRTVGSRGGRLIFAGGLVILAAAATAAVLLVGKGSPGITALAPGTIGVIDTASSRITAQLPVAGQPTRLAAGGRGPVWIGADAGTLSAVDTVTRAVGRVVAAGGFPSDVAVGEGAVWMVDGVSGLLTKIEPSYGSSAWHRRVAPPNPISYDRSRQALDPMSVAAGLGSVWTTNGSRLLTRVNPRTKRVDTSDLRASLDGVAVGGGAVWAISGVAATVFRLNRQGRVTVAIPVASHPGLESPYPIAVAVAAGFVWVLNANTETLTKIDAAQRVVVHTIPLGIQHRPLRLAVGDGAAWVANGDGTLARIDATTDRREFLPLAGSLRDVAVVGKSVWVTAGAGDGAAKSGPETTQLRALPASSCSPISTQSGTSPQYLIVGDVALEGRDGRLGAQTSEAIQFVLEQHRYRAGRYVVGYQSCDSSTATGFSAAKCRAEAHAYAKNPRVIGEIGAPGSDCSQVELPIANAAPGGPLAMVAASNTYVGFTHSGPGTTSDEPGKYFPTGIRSYVRVIAADDVQGAADALLARRRGAKQVFVLDDQDPYGAGIAADFARAARRLGMTVTGPKPWNYAAKSYDSFVAQVARSHPDAVFLGTFDSPQAFQLIKDLRAAMPTTVLVAPDGFAPPADLIAGAGAAAEGMTVSVVGRPPESLPPHGQRFVNDFKRATGNRTPVASSIAAAQATEVLLDAIASSNGTRASVAKQLFRTHITNGILGSFTFDRNGDTTEGAVTIYRIRNGAASIYDVITPSAALTR